MSTSALSNSSLAYTYTTVPTFTNTMVGFSEFTATGGDPVALTTGTIVTVLSITISQSGIYLCEATIAVNTGITVGVSLSTNAGVMNDNNTTQVDIGGTGNTIYLHTTAVLTISGGTTLYCLARSVGAASAVLAGTGYLKYTRIA